MEDQLLSKIYLFEGEDHTVGSLLQQELLKNPNVHYAGYILDHPLEKNIRLEIKNYVDVNRNFNFKEQSSKNTPDILLNEAIDSIVKKLSIIENEFLKHF